MRSFWTARFFLVFLGASLLAILCGPWPALAQPIAAPAKPIAAPSPRAASCHNGMSFDRFLADVKTQAVAAGVSRAIAEAAPNLVYDQGIVNRDRGQRVFGQVFTEFAGRMAAPYRMQQGQAKIKTYAAAFARAEKEYGVPPAVIAAFWGLESDFGANMGNLPTLRSLVSLAYDCRRSQMFENETIAALKIIDRGDLTPSEMVGSWAGELGQTQFLPTHYFSYAVDYDGDGRRDLLHSPADVIGSTANYIANGLKWRRGEPWLQEVRVPPNLSWDQADLTIQLPRSKWAQFGVTFADGRPLPNDDLPASLLLPMGRTGPAFLAYANFAAYTEWNNSHLFDHRGLSRHPHCRRGADASPGSADRATAVQRIARAAAIAGARRIQCRQGGRRDGPAEPQRREGDADQVRPARRLLADSRIAGANARRAARGSAAARPVGCALERQRVAS
jgi:lytic murein transglycosylase